jgi:hypothetical protein
MTIAEEKISIIAAITAIEDAESLALIRAVLTSIRVQNEAKTSKMHLWSNFKTILTEDKMLLEKLAQ